MSGAWAFLISNICLEGICVNLKPGLHVGECEDALKDSVLFFATALA